MGINVEDWSCSIHVFKLIALESLTRLACGQSLLLRYHCWFLLGKLLSQWWSLAMVGVGGHQFVYHLLILDSGRYLVIVQSFRLE